jgi:hypothetical protein
VETPPKGTRLPLPAAAILLGFALGIAALSGSLGSLYAQGAAASAQAAAGSQPTAQTSAGPPENAGIFPLSQVHAGQMGTAWTVFKGIAPEPMQVEILGVLRGARGPGQDLIVVQLRGPKPEYTGVVEGMSGSPVYIDGKLAGALSVRIGEFAKDPIAGITPIEQMMEVLNARDGSVDLAQGAQPNLNSLAGALANSSTLASPSGHPAFDVNQKSFQPLETPLVMSGFQPEAIRFWQQQAAGSSLETVAAGGSSGASQPESNADVAAARASLKPGSSISMQLVRGDLEISATCTVTYIDPKRLLACGHPVLGAGPVSLPMTTAEVVTTLASPLEAFKIINTGVLVGAFTQDRESAISGELGAQAHMIPMHLAIDAPTGPRKLNVEILDLPSITPQAVAVVLYESLLETNESSNLLSYHVTGNIDLSEFPSIPLDVWASAGDIAPAPLEAAVYASLDFSRLYSNGARQGAVREINLHVQAVPRRVQITLQQAHLVSSDIAHPGDTVMVEATLRPWQQPERNVRIAVKLPARLAEGNLRLLVSDGATLDRTLNQPRLNAPPPDLVTVLSQARDQHPADRIYVSLLAPETQGEINGETLTSLPLSMANALEPLRNAQDAGLNGESAELEAEVPAGGVLSGFQILNVHIEPGGGLN